MAHEDVSPTVVTQILSFFIGYPVQKEAVLIYPCIKNSPCPNYSLSGLISHPQHLRGYIPETNRQKPWCKLYTAKQLSWYKCL